MELWCESCNNENDFIEHTIEEWIVDGDGNRESAIKRETSFLCNRCGQKAGQS